MTNTSPQAISLAVVDRELKHTRSISVSVYKREDGLWDVEARLTDTKAKDYKLAMGTRLASQPVHDMTMCVSITEAFDVVAANATSHSVPYPGYCEVITPSYQQLVGLNLLKNFNRDVRARLGKTAGCTHITELTAVMPTAAVQAFSGEIKRPKITSGAAADKSPDTPPFYIDGCHALVRSGGAVQTFYPQWFKSAQSTSNSNS
jgi:Protein of unknown function (DUF2889)